MNLHGWLIEVFPVTEQPGEQEITWSLLATKGKGIPSVEGQILDEWDWVRYDFTWGEDLQDFSGLHGLTAFYRTNSPPVIVRPGLVRLGKNEMYGAFVFCGLLNGQAIPFHTETQAYEVIRWFIEKQEQWDEIYSKPSDGEAEEGAEAPKATASARQAERPARKIVH